MSRDKVQGNFPPSHKYSGQERKNRELKVGRRTFYMWCTGTKF